MAGKETKFRRQLHVRGAIASAAKDLRKASFWWPDGQDKSYRKKKKPKKLSPDEQIRRALEAERRNG
jgi:hypothetical protein